MAASPEMDALPLLVRTSGVEPRRIDSPAAAAALFAPLADASHEIAAFAYLAEDWRLLALRHTHSCCRDSIDMPLRDVVADSAVTCAAAVVMAHNHPGGDATPSRADREATRQLARALAALDVRLLDHLVVARSGVTSFRALRLL